MLKIKDNVDLKILLEHGFKYDDYDGKYIFRDYGSSLDLRINAWNRKIYIYASSSSIDEQRIIEVLYDLIKADLVEKVEE